MRFVYGFVGLFLGVFFVSAVAPSGVSNDAIVLTLAIIVAGAMAGGD